MALEQEVAKLMDQAVQRDPVVLREKTGIGKGQPVTTTEQIDLIFSIVGGQRAAITRIARELDKANGTSGV